MDEGKHSESKRNKLAQTDAGTERPDDTNSSEGLSISPDREIESPYAPRAAEKPLELPNVSNREQLRLATFAMVQQGLPLSKAAEKYKVDPDTLFIWHRTYTNFIGKNAVAFNQAMKPREPVEFDRETSRKFDKNWAEMLRIWELERPQLSPMHQRLLASPFTRWMFRGEQIDKVTVLGALAAIAFSGLAIRGGTNYLGKGDNATDPKTDPAATPLDPSDPNAFKGDSQKATLAKVAEALQAFSKLETWQERLPFIRRPEEMKPLLADYYESHPDGPLEELIISPQVSFIQRESRVFVLVQGQFTPKDSEFGEPKPIIFLAEAQEEKEGQPTFLFDWPVMVNYEPVPWETFKASKSTKTARFRLRVAKGDYYNQPFMDSEKYTSYVLLPLHREKQAYGFVEKGTPLATQLEKNLAKELNQNRAMILNLSYPEDSKFDNILQIDGIVADGWLEE